MEVEFVTLLLEETIILYRDSFSTGHHEEENLQGGLNLVTNVTK